MVSCFWNRCINNYHNNIYYFNKKKNEEQKSGGGFTPPKPPKIDFNMNPKKAGILWLIGGFVLLMIVIGILIAARSKDPDPFPGERPVLAAGFASLGACLFAIGLISTGFLSGELPLAWVLLPARIVGVLLFTLPLLLSGRLRVTRQAFLWISLLAAADLLGIGMYTIGAAQNLPVTAVLASQMAPLAAILAFFFFRERLGKGQIAGLIIMVGGVTLLALLQ